MYFKNKKMHIFFNPIIPPFGRNKSTNMKVAIAAVIKNRNKDLGNMNVNLKVNQITYSTSIKWNIIKPLISITWIYIY